MRYRLHMVTGMFVEIEGQNFWEAYKNSILYHNNDADTVTACYDENGNKMSFDTGELRDALVRLKAEEPSYADLVSYRQGKSWWKAFKYWQTRTDPLSPGNCDSMDAAQAGMRVINADHPEDRETLTEKKARFQMAMIAFGIDPEPPKQQVKLL